MQDEKKNNNERAWNSIKHNNIEWRRRKKNKQTKRSLYEIKMIKIC